METTNLEEIQHTMDISDMHEISCMIDAYRAEMALRVEQMQEKLAESEKRNQQMQKEKQVLEIENKVAIKNLLESRIPS